MPKLVMRSSLFALSLLVACGGAATPTTSSTTVIAADDRPHDQGAAARFARDWPDSTTRTYSIRWTSPGTTWLYDGTLALTRVGSTVDGTFHWRLLAVGDGMAFLQSRVGSTAVEQIRGRFDPTLGELVLETTSLSDPSLIGSASYRIRLEGASLRGMTAGIEDGIWDGVLDGTGIE